MAERKPDRRVGRTRRRLKEALLELIDERDYDAITVRDITERADVGRSTFYSHFQSKEDLLFSGFDRWLLSVPAPAGGGDGAGGGPEAEFAFVGPLLRHVRMQRRFFRATVGRGGGGPRLRRRMTDLLVARFRAELASPAGEPTVVLDARAHGAVGAFLGIVGWWLEDPERLDADAVAAVFRGVVSRGRD